MADPLFLLSVSVCRARWPAESGQPRDRCAPTGQSQPAGRSLRLTGCLPEGHDRTMNGTNGQKQLIRPRDGRMVAGVCAGIGQFFGIDANLIRIVFAVLTVFSAGAAALVYLLAWVVVPEEGESGSIAENYLNKKKQ